MAVIRFEFLAAFVMTSHINALALPLGDKKFHQLCEQSRVIERNLF